LPVEERALFLVILGRIRGEDRATLFAAGGYEIIRETVLLAIQKIKDQRKSSEA
jgi:hypothetical protein